MGLNRASPLQDAAAGVVSSVQALLNNVVMVAGPTMSQQQHVDRLRSSVAGAFLSERHSINNISIAPPPLLTAVPATSAATPSSSTSSPTRGSIGGGGGVNGAGGAAAVGARQGLVLQTVHQTPEQAARSAVLQRDAFLSFRALCKLSIRTSDQATAMDATAAR